MNNSLEFTISEKTLEKILREKEKSGFGNKSWDEWFAHISKDSTNAKTQLEKMEKSISKYFYENDYEQWVKNFALNLNDIWRESSARELDPTSEPSYKMEEHSAIVIGKGPSVKKHKHLELLAESDYKGSIVCTDGALINTLKAGVTPEKFLKFYVVAIDAYETQIRYYQDEVVDRYGKKIKGICSTLTHPNVIKRIREAGIKIYWLHTLFDYDEGRKSFNQTSGLMVRAKNHSKGLPAIQTGGNVGTSAWFISWQILKCATVALIGINHGWNEDDPWDLILSHRKKNQSKKIDKNDPKFKKLYPKIYNPEFKTYCILDPIFQFYSLALKEFISRSPKTIKTINATEGGSIFGDGITCMKFEKFLKSF